MIYEYTAYTAERKTVKGTIDGTSEAMAEDALYRAGYQRILSLTAVRPKTSFRQMMPSIFGVKGQDVIDFSRELASLIEAGVTILNALQLLEDQSTRPAFKKIITELVNELRGGSSFSAAISKYPQVFSGTYRQVMKASEQSGSLEAGLRHIAAYMDKQAATKKKIRGALAYPSLIAVMGLGVSIVLITVALPPLVDMFSSLDAELPLMTRILIGVSDFLIDYKLHILGALVVFAGLFGVCIRMPALKLTFDRLLLRLPIIGSIILQRNMYHFCHTTGMLLKAGLQLPEIMNIVIPSIGNSVIHQALVELRDRLVQGQGLSQPMAEIGLFPKILVEMVAVGEKTGDLEGMVSNIADRFEYSVEQRISGMVKMIEPAMTLAAGLMVGFVALSFIGPLYSIVGSME
ncbi:MAG: type II secretion system F family protein [Dehalococcoidales bacterium]|nr:MAG: type II secretion system F family protein [Dehalococcoidales bacterium]